MKYSVKTNKKMLLKRSSTTWRSLCSDTKVTHVVVKIITVSLQGIQTHIGAVRQVMCACAQPLRNRCIEKEISSIRWHFRHWLHCQLSFDDCWCNWNENFVEMTTFPFQCALFTNVQTGIDKTSIGIKLWKSNHIHVKHCKVITNPWLNSTAVEVEWRIYASVI